MSGGETPLGRIIAGRIAAQGPMRVDSYMALCLGHPEHGYYIGRDPLGRAGDFITAPEISQMFGEMIGGWLARAWQEMGAPDRVALVELGPGRGTLLRDALRVARRLPGFAEAAAPWLVETSPALRARQAEALRGTGAVWVDTLAEVPEGPILLVANEFFDALPIRQFQRADTLWRERLVGEGPAFVWGAPRGDAALDARFPGAGDGVIVEVCAAGEAVMRDIAARIAARGGAALVVDYGAWDGVGDTLQALRAHEFVSPLVAPGHADLTAHVRFRALAEAAGTDVAVAGPVGQGVFLERLGITERARALIRGKAEAEVESVIAAHRRLTHPAEMGNLFQVLALSSVSAPLPAGFEPSGI